MGEVTCICRECVLAYAGVVGLRVPARTVDTSSSAAAQFAAGVVALVLAAGAGLVHAQGEIVSWGRVLDPPEEISDLLKISAGGSHTLVLESEGSVVGWGSNVFGQNNV